MEENIAVQNNAAASAAEARPAQGFDALLRERDFQSEFDRRVSRALETARGKWAQETERRIEKVRAEAEARAHMSGEERMAHDFAERERALDVREQALSQRELRAEAIGLLRERGLPGELAEMMNYAGAEQMHASLETAERAFKTAVQAGVERRMRGAVPQSGMKNAAPQDDADYYRAHYSMGSKAK